jgi:serine/threonine protein kinase
MACNTVQEARMTPERWRQVDEILQAALARGADEQAAFLNHACAGDAALRREVEALLAFRSRAERFIETPALGRPADAGEREREQPAGDVSLLGRVLDGKYRLEALLGRGGMGEVYGATHLGTRRSVALKVVAPALMQQPEFVERFRREAEAAGRLRHPNIVDVTDFGFAEADGRRLAYLVMEYLDGRSLAQFLAADRTPPLELALDILEQLSSAVDEAHRQGVIHRDLKPANVWLEPDRRGGYNVKVLDFGLAKLRDPGAGEGWAGVEAGPVPGAAERPTVTYVPRPSGTYIFEPTTLPLPPPDTPDVQSASAGDLEGTHSEASGYATLTRAGDLLGTPCYMSPEQCRGERLDARSDIYSLGVIAYEMLAGTVPFQGGTLAVLVHHVERTPTPPSVYNPSVPRGVDLTVLSALAKRREDRPASAGAFARALRAAGAARGAILRQALELLGRHFAVCFRLSFFGGYIPLAVAGALMVSGIARDLQSGSGVSDPLIMGFLTVVPCFLYANLVTGSVFVPVVAQLLEAPERPVKVRYGFGLLASSALPYLYTVFPDRAWAVYPAFVVAATLLRVSEFVIAVAGVAILGALFVRAWGFGGSVRRDRFIGPVVAVEGLTQKAARERAAQLAARCDRLYGEPFGLGLAAVGAFALAMVALVHFPAYVIDGVADSIVRERLGAGWAVVGLAGFGLAVSAALLVNALTGICSALAYLRTREIGGEPVDVASLPIRTVESRVQRLTAAPANRGLRWVVYGLAILFAVPWLGIVTAALGLVGAVLALVGLRALAQYNVWFRAAFLTCTLLACVLVSSLAASGLELDYRAADLAVGDLREAFPERVRSASLDRITDDGSEIGRGRTATPASAFDRALGEYSDGTTVLVLRYRSKQEALAALQAKMKAEYDEDALLPPGHRGGYGTGETQHGSWGQRTISRSVMVHDSEGLPRTIRGVAASWNSVRAFSNPFSWAKDSGLGDGVLFVVEGKDGWTTDGYLEALTGRARRRAASAVGPWTTWLVFAGRLGYAITVWLICAGIVALATRSKQEDLARSARRWRAWYPAAVIAYLLGMHYWPLALAINSGPVLALYVPILLGWLAVNCGALALTRRASLSRLAPPA